MTAWWIATCGVAILTRIISARRIIFNQTFDNSFISNNILDEPYLRSRTLASEPMLKPADHLVESLPGLSPSAKIGNHYAGHLLADPNKGGYHFYWLFESPEHAESKPLLIWLNGGPGCSSMDGLFLELGPIKLDSTNNNQLKVNPYSWHKVANVLFVDQPVGTGLSFTSSNSGLARDDETVNKHFMTFLNNFLVLHDRYLLKNDSNASSKRKSRPIIFAGESHAGHYIPSIIHYLWTQPQSSSNHIEIQIAGVALGNPWIDPMNQYNPADFAHGLGILTAGQVNHLQAQDNLCRQNLRDGKFNTKACLTLLDHVIDASSTGNGAKVIMYDIRKYAAANNAKQPSFPPGHEAVESYLNRPDVKKALHANRNPNRYVECADPPYYALAHQDGKGVIPELQLLLNKDLPLLIYSGQYDLICNHLNIEKVTDGLLTWKDRDTWLTTQPQVWLVNNKPVGYTRKAGSLQTLTVLNAGHMVPMDIPEIALQMITLFIQGKSSFSSGPSRIGVTPVATVAGSNTNTVVACSTLSSSSDGSSSNNNNNNSGQKQKRLLLTASAAAAAVSSAGEVSYYPVLLNVIPLEHGIFLRLRAQHIAHSTPSHHQHQQQQQHGSSSRHHTTAWDAIRANPLFYILIQPGDQIMQFSQLSSSSSLTGNFSDSSNHHVVDIILDQLTPGVVAYSISLHYGYNMSTTTARVGFPASFHRQMSVHVGCYFAGFGQCCHHGECLAFSSTSGSSSSSSSKCRCDSGYSGDHCNHYSVLHAPHKGVEQHHHHNITADDVVCPPRIHPSPAALTVNVKSLPPQSSLATATEAAAEAAAAAVVSKNISGNNGGSGSKCQNNCCHYLHLSLSPVSNKRAIDHAVLLKEFSSLLAADHKSQQLLLQIKVEMKDGNKAAVIAVDICGPQTVADKAAALLMEKTRGVGWAITLSDKTEAKVLFVTQLTPIERENYWHTAADPVFNPSSSATTAQKTAAQQPKANSSIFAATAGMLLPWLSAHWVIIGAVGLVIGLCCLLPLCINGVGSSTTTPARVIRRR